jgi:hypothetical protein
MPLTAKPINEEIRKEILALLDQQLSTSIMTSASEPGEQPRNVESVCQSVARLTPYQSTLPSSTLVSQDTSGCSA